SPLLHSGVSILVLLDHPPRGRRARPAAPPRPGFDPCSPGSPSAGLYLSTACHRPVPVSILVLLDHPPREHESPPGDSPAAYVSILVLLDHPPRARPGVPFSPYMRVSILVLLDHPPRVHDSPKLHPSVAK